MGVCVEGLREGRIVYHTCQPQSLNMQDKQTRICRILTQLAGHENMYIYYLASVASPPSHANEPIFLYTGDVHTVILYVLLILRAHSPARQQCFAFN